MRISLANMLQQYHTIVTVLVLIALTFEPKLVSSIVCVQDRFYGSKDLKSTKFRKGLCQVGTYLFYSLFSSIDSLVAPLWIPIFT